MTSDLERRLRALRDELPEPPVPIDPDRLVDPSVVDLHHDAPRPHRRRLRWAIAALVAAVLVTGVVVAVELVRDGRGVDRSDPVGVTTSPPVATADLVVRDGDRVTGSGEVYAVPGLPVRFCAPAPVAATTIGVSVSGTAAPPSPLEECPSGVAVEGVDLASLTDRQERGGAVAGYADLVGIYRDGVLTVQEQRPFVRSAPAGPGYSDTPPCAAPEGGWPRGAADANIDTGPLTDFQAAHADEVVGTATLRPSSTQAVAYVLTSGDVTAATAALGPHYGASLCVTHTDVTPARLAAARAAFVAALASPTGEVYEVGDENITPPPLVSVGCVLVSPGLAATAAPFPGLVRFDPWLAPVA